MRRNPAFDLFEEICNELSGQGESILVDDEFSPGTLEEVKRWFKESSTMPAVTKALAYLRKHFEARGSELPFIYDLATVRATAINSEYIDFVSDSQNQRGISNESRDFE